MTTLPFAEFMRTIAKLRDDKTRQIVPMRPHAEQQRVIDAVDAIDLATGLRRYRTIIESWPRKHYKTTNTACIAVWMLVFDPFHDHREVYIIASDRDQAKSACLKEAKRIVQRDPWLKARIKPGVDGMTYTDERGVDHTMRALARDAAGAHGLNASCVIVDEAWNFSNWDVLEGLSESPSRQCPLTVWASYAGLISQRKDGNPFYDTLTRAQVGDDPYTFLSHITGRSAVLAAGVVSEEWLARLARQFEHVPSKYRRLGLNEWSAGDAGSFLLATEIQDAIDESRSGTASAPVPDGSIGVDLGLSHDRAAIVASHVDAATGQLIVDHVELHQGTKSRPVSLTLIEERVVALSRLLRIKRVFGDRWQLAMLAERWTTVHHLTVQPISCESAWLDRAATAVKSWFRDRTIRVPNDPEFLQELEGLEGEELRRRDRVRFTATGANHDDACVALALSTTPFLGRDKRPEDSIIGKPVWPGDALCLLQINQLYHYTSCFLMGGHRYPPDPICKQCVLWKTVKLRRDAHVAKTGETINEIDYLRQHPMRPNAVMREIGWHATDRMLGSLL